MTAPTRIPTRFAVRLTAVLSLALFGAALAGLSAARDPAPAKAPDKPNRPPEQEDTNPPPPTHKVTVDEPDESAGAAPAPRAVDLRQAAHDAKQLPVRNLFGALAVPHDLLKLDEANHNKQLNIEPFPEFVDDKPEQLREASFEVTPFAAGSWKPEAPIKVERKTVAFLTPYEKLAWLAVDDFLQPHYENDPPDSTRFVSRYDQDVAAEQVLTTVLLRLKSERQRGGRAGDEWEDVETALKQRLLKVMLEQLDALVRTQDWDAAFALTQRLAGAYPSKDYQDQFVVPLRELVKQTLAQSADEAQKSKALRRLRHLYELFPNNKAVQPIADALQKKAAALVQEAQEADKKHQNPDLIARLLNEAQDTWPATPELRTSRLLLGNEHPVLRVGVRGLPSLMSPARAVTDSDRRAVELLFESLVKLRPDGAGGARWEAGLADRLPGMAPRGRDFTLSAEAYWSNHDRLTAIDVRDTVDRMAKGQGAGRPPAWGDLLEPVEVPEPTRFRLTLHQGWLDPLALMNFKILPSKPDLDAASEQFARRPVGSGPYVYDPDIQKDNGRDCVAFRANLYYEARPGKAGLPRIEEIHFIGYKDPVAEFAPANLGRLDLALDLTAKEADDLKKKAADLNLTVTGPAAPNRRIYFLAVNHRKPALANAAFRCALAYAINREEILDKDFRAKPGQLHAALNGPYPIMSWAANPDPKYRHKYKYMDAGADKERDTLDPFDAAAAKAKKDESQVGDTTLKLKYPSGDPAVEKAMTDLAAQVKKEIGVTLTPEAEPPDALRHDVEETPTYDLAYYHYDFPDDVYWLGPLLDPRGGPNGNYLGYSGGDKADLIPLLKDESRQRDFPQVREWAHALHARFLTEEMPFVPLWQLDSLAAVHSDVVTPPFDPLLVFTDVELWTLKRK